MRLGDAQTQAAFVYGEAFDAIAPGIMDQASSIAMPGEDTISAVARAVSTVFMTDAQRRLLNVQIQRAQSGLPPLDMSQYGVGVNVGLGADTQKLILIGMGLLAAVLIVPKLIRK